MSDTIILQIVQSRTIDTEVEAVRQYLYARQIFMQTARHAFDLGRISLETEEEEITRFFYFLSKGE